MFTQRFNWAIPPQTLLEFDAGLRGKESLDGFRWLREGRSSSRCPSFIRAQNSIFILCSPVDVYLEPLEQFTFDCDFEELPKFQRDNAIGEIWRRDGMFIGLSKPSGLKKFDFQVGDRWEAMFLPNGEHSWEWRLGVDFKGPSDCSLMVFDEPSLPEIETIAGIFTEKQISTMEESSGISVAFRIKSSVQLRRGTPIARCIVLQS